MDKEASGASAFEHGTVAGVLRQKGALGLAARSQADSGPVRVGEEPYLHLKKYRTGKLHLRSGGDSEFDARYRSIVKALACSTVRCRAGSRRGFKKR